MSPASTSKSKDKTTDTESTNAGSANGYGIPASAYNPLLGYFHDLELETSSSAMQSNGCFRSMDENKEHNGNSLGAGREFDAISNSGSWSGESEEHKEKSTNQYTRRESIPGAENDKRDKIRQMNERKHQRQKERRAQELHEKCRGCLMSRKLECLSQQLVAMGFSAERAKRALIQKEGKVDQSVSWLLDEEAEEAEEDKQRDRNFSANDTLKIDISDELCRIADLEIMYKCLKQEVEKAIVACEGDMDKAAEILKVQKQELPACPPKPKETGDAPTPSSYDVKHSYITNQYHLKAPPRPSSSTSIARQLRDARDFTYTKTVVPDGILTDNSKHDVQVPIKTSQPQADWTKPQQMVSLVTEKSWPVLGSVASPFEVSPQLLKTKTRYAVTGGKSENIQQIGAVKEPVTVLQRPKTQSSKPFAVTSIAASTHNTAPSWHLNGGFEFVENGVVAQIPSARSLSTNNETPYQLSQPQQQLLYQHQSQVVTGNIHLDSTRHTKSDGALSTLATSSTLAPASSLGLFCGTIAPNITSGPSSHVDWSNGYDMRQVDYANIDWSFKSSNSMAIHRPVLNRLSSLDGSSNSSMVGEQVNITPMGEWSSPFEENDIFGLPRQFVSHSM